MLRKALEHRCILWGLTGVSVGVAQLAYAQESAMVLAPSEDLLIEMIRNGGYPMLMGMVFWAVSRGISLPRIPIDVTVTHKRERERERERDGSDDANQR